MRMAGAALERKPALMPKPPLDHEGERAMLKVVIVEDNPSTVQALTRTIDWAALDCEVAGCAYDGEEGRSLIEETLPDIVLTDIRMPQINGLDMIAMIREKLPDCKIIIITGYEEFEYASRAIKLSVFDYLLKPIDNEDVMRSVARAVQAAQRKQKSDGMLEQAVLLKRRAMLFSLLTNDSHRGQGVYDMISEIGLQFDAYYILVVQLQDERVYSQATMHRIDSVLARRNANAVSVLLYDAVVVFVMRDSLDAGWRKDACLIAEDLAAQLTSPLAIGVSLLTTSRHAIRSAYHQGRQALLEATLNNRSGGCSFYQADGSCRGGEGMGKLYRCLDTLIEKADLSDASVTEAARVIAEQSGLQYSYLRAMVSLYCIALCRKFPVAGDGKMDGAMCATLYVSNREETEACLKQVAGLLRELRNEQQKNRYSQITRNAIQYIRLHAIEDFNLKKAADMLCVSPNYLSALVRKDTGVPFHEHVLKAKMGVACTMLADPRIRIEDVAHAVGYSNYYSFFNAFKRALQMTPSDYRNRQYGN